ncbi:metallopeptidase family protein [Trueperella sp.]|uniref:metallopeptidase family protein n=1 Tax=Trueperella sp. TaxID=2699835 RepID=UPI003734DAE7
MNMPRRSHAPRRDRHGRGPRGPILPMSIPGWRTRADQFDDLLAWELGEYKKRLGRAMARIDFAVMEVPGGDPAPWESGVPLARYLPFERPAKIHGRVIFYRMPILSALRTDPDPRMLIHSIVTSQLATALNRMPEDIDYLAG